MAISKFLSDNFGGKRGLEGVIAALECFGFLKRALELLIFI